MSSNDLPRAKMPEARPVRSKGVVRKRMGAQLKTALEAMAHKGLSLPLAAAEAGMAVVSLKQAFRKNHVKQAYNQLVMEIRENAGQLAYQRINVMSETATSETVKLEANKWVAGVDNIAPVKRVEGRFSHNVTFGGFEYGDEARDVTPDADQQSGGDDD